MLKRIPERIAPEYPVSFREDGFNRILCGMGFGIVGFFAGMTFQLIVFAIVKVGI